MIVLINGTEQNSMPSTIKKADNLAVFINTGEAEGTLLYKEMSQSKKPHAMNKTAHFEGYVNMDYLLLHLPAKGGVCEAFLRGNTVLFVLKSIANLQKFMPDFFELMRENDGMQADVILAEFLLALTENKMAELNRMETKIADLEDKLLAKKDMNYGQNISALRKTLLDLKQYYQSFSMLVEDMLENLNGLINQDALKILGVVQKRADRIYKSVLYLRDYVTQVRESYQSELDLTLNEIMKLFTLVTVIFMPLGIIVGWYGMNLIMPETAWGGTYILVMVLCVAVVVGTIWYFRRKKWF